MTSLLMSSSLPSWFQAEFRGIGHEANHLLSDARRATCRNDRSPWMLGYVIIFQMGLALYFLLYTIVFVGFFYVLLYRTGCPSCTNIQCPFNPDFGT